MDRMPDEMLLRIFTVGCEREIKETQKASSYGGRRSRRRKPFAALVSQVCGQWNDIVSSRRAKHLWLCSVALEPRTFHNGNIYDITRWKETLESSGMEECDIDVYITVLPSVYGDEWEVVQPAIAMLVPFTRQLRSLVVKSDIPEVIDFAISIVSVTGATPRMDNIVLDSGGCYPPLSDHPMVPNVYIGTEPNQFLTSFQGESLKRVSLDFHHFPQNLGFSPYLHDFCLCNTKIEWNQLERLLQPLQVLRKLHLDLRFVDYLPPSSKDNFISFKLPKLTDLWLLGNLRRLSSFLHFLRPSTVVTLTIDLKRLMGDQKAFTISPILFDSLTELRILSNNIVSIRDFLTSIYAPSLMRLTIDHRPDYWKADSEHFPSHTLLHDYFVLPPRVRIKEWPFSRLLLFYSFLNFEGTESLSITLSGEDTKVDYGPNPNEIGHSKVYPPVKILSNLRFLEIENRGSPPSLDQFFRGVRITSETELKINWGLLEKTDPETLRQASVYAIHSLQISLAHDPSRNKVILCNTDILCNFQSVTKLIVILYKREPNCDWLQGLILPAFEDHDCSDTPLIFPRLEDLECRCRYLTTFHDHWKNRPDLLFYMTQITESRRTRGMPLKRAILVDRIGNEINF